HPAQLAGAFLSRGLEAEDPHLPRVLGPVVAVPRLAEIAPGIVADDVLPAMRAGALDSVHSPSCSWASQTGGVGSDSALSILSRQSHATIFTIAASPPSISSGLSPRA